MSRRAALIVLASCKLSCTSGPDVSTLELALFEVPPEVASTTVVVRRADEIVASATVSPTQRTVALGVPAEVPIEITVLARTSRPGPGGVGRMPAYVGRVVRSVPLSAEITRVTITLRPAGVLTVIATSAPDVPRTPVLIEPIDDDGLALSLRLREAGYVQSYVLRAGRYRARFDLAPGDDPPPFAIDAPQALFVAREQESVFVLSAPESPELDPQAPAGLLIGAPSIAEVGAVVPVVITASAAVGLVPLEATVAWRADTAPLPAHLVTKEGGAAGLLDVLPATLRLSAAAPTRAWLRADALLADGRALSASAVVEVRASGTSSAAAAAIAARIGDVDARRTGTELLLELLDPAGAYARTSTAILDLSGSDPWIDLGGPTIARIGPASGGHVLRRIAVPSSPRGKELALRVRATDPAGRLVGTATVTLPAVDLP